MTTGTIIKALGGFYFVKADTNANQIFSCSLRGKLRQSGLGVMVGDKVEYSVIDGEIPKAIGDVHYDNMGMGVVESILPRDNQLVRPKIANITQCLIVMAAADPEPDFMLLDRLLISVSIAQIKPVICFNKIDLLLPESPVWQQIEAYEQIGFPIYTISTYTGAGKEKILEVLANNVTVLAGPSGAGKSSLLNMLQHDLDLTTGGISEKLGRGRHTTRCVELLTLANGSLVADAPGFSRLDLTEGLSRPQIAACYPDFVMFADKCHYDSCSHNQEPDCGVKQALDSGKIDMSRYKRYLMILDDVKY